MARVVMGKTKDEAAKVAVKVTTKQQRKEKNLLANQDRAAKNREAVARFDIPSETVVRNITRISKKGKKTIATTVTVEKPKRNSKLIRKHEREVARLLMDKQLSKIEQMIAGDQQEVLEEIKGKAK